MYINILDDAVVSPNINKDTSNDVCVYPLTSRLNNGDLLCIYRRGKEKHSYDGKLIVQMSRDEGINWSEQIIIFDGTQHTHPVSVHTGALCQVSDGTVLAIFTIVDACNPDIYVFSNEGRRLRHQLCVAGSNDGGKTWSTPVVHKFVGAPQNVYIGSRPFLLPDGDLFVPLEVTGKHGQEIILATISSDCGNSFQPVVVCAEDKTGNFSYGDPKFAILPDGRIIMLLWTFLTAGEESIAVHRSVSEDNGRTWSLPVSVHVQSQIMMPLSVDSNRLIAAGNVRTISAGIRLWFSSDDGESWNTGSPIQMWDAREETMIGTVLMSENSPLKNTSTKIWNELPDFTFGTPDLVLLCKNKILLTYYAELHGITHVRACRFEVEQ